MPNWLSKRKKQVTNILGYRCQKCGATSGLTLHHLIPRHATRVVKSLMGLDKNQNQNINAFDNEQLLIPLCRACHDEIEKLYARHDILLRTEKKLGISHEGLAGAEHDRFVKAYVNECRTYKRLCFSFFGRDIRKEYMELKLKTTMELQ